MKNLVQLFIEQKIEKRLFASFGKPNRENSEEEIRKLLKSPDLKMLKDSGVDLMELKEIYFDALEKAFKKLKEQQLSLVDQVIAAMQKS